MNNIDLSNYIDRDEMSSLAEIAKSTLQYKLKDLKLKKSFEIKGVHYFCRKTFMQLLKDGKFKINKVNSENGKKRIHKLRQGTDGFPLKQINFTELQEQSKLLKTIFRV